MIPVIAQSILTTITFLSVLAAEGYEMKTPVSPLQDNSNMPSVESPLSSS